VTSSLPGESGATVVSVEFPEVSTAEANQLASELAERIAEATSFGVRPHIEKANQQSQDFGTIVTIALASPVVLAVAQGIRDFIAKSNASIVLRTPNGEIWLRGGAAANADAGAIARALAPHSRR
jgi:hypothetical protein